jgi:hypothetical protein
MLPKRDMNSGVNVLLSICLFVYGHAAIPRRVHINGQNFVLPSTGETIVLAGPNVVVKGPPYLPSVEGDTVCKDVVTDECMAKGTCTSCSTFNQADIDHIKSLGYNFIRLGVVWAGAQPRDEDALDPDFVARLHAILNLTDANGLHVMLDNHGDMVGSAGCGNGAPMWFQKRAAPELIGKPLTTSLPFSLVAALEVKKLAGYDTCGDNATKWSAYAGDPNYNLLNECCLAINAPTWQSARLPSNPPALGFTTINQKTMDYMVQPGEGRDLFIRFWRLMAETVQDHPSAFAAELTNEPVSIRRRWMFDTWRASAEAISAIIPDMSVSIMDVGESPDIPSFLETKELSDDTVKWIKSSNNTFFAWHYGYSPVNVINMRAISRKWDIPTFATETTCIEFEAARKAGISHSYWHYSCYCNTGPAFGNRKVPDESFGACILGWDGGHIDGCKQKSAAIASSTFV